MIYALLSISEHTISHLISLIEVSKVYLFLTTDNNAMITTYTENMFPNLLSGISAAMTYLCCVIGLVYTNIYQMLIIKILKKNTNRK